jgi:hypothetical protein
MTLASSAACRSRRRTSIDCPLSAKSHIPTVPPATEIEAEDAAVPPPNLDRPDLDLRWSGHGIWTAFNPNDSLLYAGQFPDPVSRDQVSLKWPVDDGAGLAVERTRLPSRLRRRPSQSFINTGLLELLVKRVHLSHRLLQRIELIASMLFSRLRFDLTKIMNFIYGSDVKALCSSMVSAMGFLID